MNWYRRLVAIVWHMAALLLAAPVLAAPTHIAAELVAEAPAEPGETVMEGVFAPPGLHK